MVDSWKVHDDKKLAELFRKGHSKGGCDPKRKDKKYVQEHVLAKFFPERVEDYKNFGPLYCRKADKWNLNKDLTHARKNQGALSMCADLVF